MDKKLYCENWSDTIRPAILKRDSYRCQHCGAVHRAYYLFNGTTNKVRIEVDEYKEYKENGITVRQIHLQVAHLDCDKNNNDSINLLSLCGSCHLKQDKAWKNLLRLAKKKSSTI